MSKTLAPHLQFDGITPVAEESLGGLVWDSFGNGRLSICVAHHGGLTRVSYIGNQCDAGYDFFSGALGTPWNKCFRFYVSIGDKRYYPVLNKTKLYPFGLGSHDTQAAVELAHDLLLLPDALVQRIHIKKNSRKLPVRIGMLHQESISACNREGRTWSDFVFHPKLNAFIASCLDTSLPRTFGETESLAQKGLPTIIDAPKATTWIGLGCTARITTHCGYHPRSKHYIHSDALKGNAAAFFLVFATSREALIKRLRQLSKSVIKECDDLVSVYERRLLTRPRIDTGNKVLNSAFGQFPEMIHAMKIPDRPGAVNATLARSAFVWGWDGMTPFLPSTLSNEPEYAAHMLRFFQETCDARFGIPVYFSSTFKLMMKEPFPAQCQYIAGLYQYVAVTGDLSVAREVFPMCKFLLDRCRKDIVGKTGLVSSNALWPDFPEAMGENGHDISSMNNSFLYQGLRSMEYIAAQLGHDKLAAECREWARRLRINFVKYLYDDEKGYFISSCSSVDFKPRKHYCCQAIFWITPFARELVSHAPKRISAFMDKHLRSQKCLLSLPHWDTAWMADGNQLGSSYPIADNFYLHIHKIVGDTYGIKAWLGDVEWFWQSHTAPEAFTPEAENEDELGPDHIGQKQMQTLSSWYSCFYTGLAGLDIDHEGITLTPWGDMPLQVRNLRLRGVSIDLKINGRGTHIGMLKLNGKVLPAGSRKIAWKSLKGKSARIELVRTEKAPAVPVIVRADGLRIMLLKSADGHLSARIGGDMTGEIVVQTPAKSRIFVNGKPADFPYDASMKTATIPFSNDGDLKLEIWQK